MVIDKDLVHAILFYLKAMDLCCADSSTIIGFTINFSFLCSTFVLQLQNRGHRFGHSEAVGEDPLGESKRITCKKCGKFHLWICTDRVKHKARWCQVFSFFRIVLNMHIPSNLHNQNRNKY